MFAVSADNSTCVNRTLQWRWLETQKFSNASVIDLQKKETARASMRKMVKHLLKKFKYPPEDYDILKICILQYVKESLENHSKKCSKQKRNTVILA